MTRSNDNHQTRDFRPNGPVAWLFEGSRDPAYRLVVWAFVLGSAAHLWLADAWQLDWLTANIVYLLGIIVLAASGGALGWGLSVVGLAIPLLFLRDQLTQSVFLLCVAVAGSVFTFVDAWARPRVANCTVEFLRVCRWLTIATYGFAVWHKLNSEFFDPRYGCATYGMRELAEYYRLDPALVSIFDGGHAPLAIVLEIAIPVAYLFGRRHLARMVAVIFHIPLTITMAPAFAFVMAVGHAAFITAEERRILVQSMKRHWRALLGAASLVTIVSLVVHDAWPEWTMIPREWLLWLLLLWFFAAATQMRGARAAPDRPRPASRKCRWFGHAVVGLFVINCATPYLGVQFQHAGAMLSNLRIDEGCWNHYVLPESIRLTDDYVRVEEVWFGEPGRVEEYEKIVLEQLWSPPQIRQMRRNWCRPELRPFYMRGTFRGREWSVRDLCDEAETWPFQDDGVFGVELFGDYLRYQKNLMRECPQECIH